MEPSWHLNHIQKWCHVKIAWKQNLLIFLIEFNDFSKFGDRFSEANSTKNQLKNGIPDSMPNLNPFWTENRAQDTSKTLPRRPHDAPRRPKTPQDAPKTAPGRLQDDPKTPPRRPKILPRRPQDGSKLPKTPQNASKTPQNAHGRLQDASRPRFWSLQASWINFRTILLFFFIDFWSIFVGHGGSVWGRSCIIIILMIITIISIISIVMWLCHLGLNLCYSDSIAWFIICANLKRSNYEFKHVRAAGPHLRAVGPLLKGGAFKYI